MNVDSRRQRISILILIGLVALILQVVVAPSIAIFSVVPNFIVVAVAMVALVNNATRSALYGFILGFCYDLLSQGPVGVMALILTIMGYAVSTLNKGSFISNRVIEMAAAVIAVFVGEVLHGVVLAIIGYDADIVYSLLFRALPGALYEAIILSVALVIIYSLPRKRKSGNVGNMGNLSKAGNIPGYSTKRLRSTGRMRSSKRKLR